VLRHNGDEVGSAMSSAASGHPAAGVVWLVAQLAPQDRKIEAGDVVITGGLTKAIPLGPSDHIDAIFDGETRVAVHRPDVADPGGRSGIRTHGDP
jgi:2-keto-4-pentenoate hydratase